MNNTRWYEREFAGSMQFKLFDSPTWTATKMCNHSVAVGKSIVLIVLVCLKCRYRYGTATGGGNSATVT